jgi:hypothetical protein
MSHVDLQPFDPLRLTEDDLKGLDLLIDKDAVAQANERHAAAAKRCDAVRLEYDAAKTETAAATDEYEQALSGESKLSVMDAFRAMQDAVSKRDVTGEVLNRTCQILDKIERSLNGARGVGYRPIYVEGVKRRIAAAKKADSARAMLREAEGDYVHGTRIVLHALGHGTSHAVPPEAFNTTLTPEITELRERQMWSGSWYPGQDWTAVEAIKEAK